MKKLGLATIIYERNNKWFDNWKAICKNLNMEFVDCTSYFPYRLGDRHEYFKDDIWNSKQLMFSELKNRALKKCIENDVDYILINDDDEYIKQEELVKILSYDSENTVIRYNNRVNFCVWLINKNTMKLILDEYRYPFCITVNDRLKINNIINEIKEHFPIFLQNGAFDRAKHIADDDTFLYNIVHSNKWKFIDLERL